MDTIASSELIINGDGSVFHLHLCPGEVADKIILVGDPARVEAVARHFDRTEVRRSNREFFTITGYIGDCRLSVVSTGIGTDNIDIVMTELDALVNVDFTTRTVKPQLTQLTITRIGTSGALQPDICLGDVLMSRASIGFDNTVKFYNDHVQVCDDTLERKFLVAVDWSPLLPRPYAVYASSELCELYSDIATEGITISAPGFYGAQGRKVRLPLTDPKLNEKIRAFTYKELRIMNYEMEGSALAAMAAMLGHRAVTLCVAIAQRARGNSDTDYQKYIEKLIENTLQKLVTFG